MTNLPSSDDPMIAVLSLLASENRSIAKAESPIIADNVSQYMVSERQLKDTVAALREHGFEVTNASSLGVSIKTTVKQFQEIFGLRLEPKKVEGRPLSIRFFDLEHGSDAEDAVIPENLRNLVDAADPVRPPDFFMNLDALPPARVPERDYPYLNVPSELAVVLNAAASHARGITGAGISVAMPDTGFEPLPYFEAHGYKVRNTILVPPAKNAEVDIIGHGSFIASALFAVAPGVELIPIKMQADGQSTIQFTDARSALAVAIDQRPRVITCSWGFPYEQQGNDWDNLRVQLRAPTAEIARAVGLGMTIVIAAGNKGALNYPSSSPDVIAVGGVHFDRNSNNDDPFEASSYASSFISSIFPDREVPDVCGLVGNALTFGGRKMRINPLLMMPVPKGSAMDDLPPLRSAYPGWALGGGTSAAAPQVAGAVALMLQVVPSLAPSEIKELLMSTCRDVRKGRSATSEKAKKGKDRATGMGLIDVEAALTKLTS